jgi:hypothetical protein
MKPHSDDTNSNYYNAVKNIVILFWQTRGFEITLPTIYSVKYSQFNAQSESG